MEPLAIIRPVRYREIDLLRFLSALSVVLYHYTFYGFRTYRYSPIRYEALEPVTKYGYLGVQLFFIISGYVILMTAYDKTVKEFFISRIVRLYPAFWVACTLCFLAVHFFGPHPGDTDWVPTWSIDIRRYLFNMTMLEDFFGSSVLDVSYWTLTYELIFYFLISLLISYKLMGHLYKFIVFWLIYTAFTGPNPVVQAGFFKLFMPNCSPYFITGMLFFLLTQKTISNWKIYILLLFAFILSLRSEQLFTTYTNKPSPDQPTALVVALVIATFFLLFWLITSRRLNLERFKWLSSLGAITYPLYLLHNNIGFIFLKNFRHTSNKYLVLLSLIGLMLLAAYLVHKGIEKRLGRTLGQQLNQLLKSWV